MISREQSDTLKGMKTCAMGVSYPSRTRPGTVQVNSNQELFDTPEIGDVYQALATVRRIRYQSDDGLFTIAEVTDETGERVTLTGNLIGIEVDDDIEVRGTWVRNPRFGYQVRVERAEAKLPVTPEGIAKYLTTQLDGIGPKLARRIVDAFDTATVDILDQAPERLQEVSGIGKKKLAKIKSSWDQHQSTRKVFLFLQSHGVSPAYATRIIRRFDEDTIRVVQEQPYALAREVRGIGFHIADNIAQHVGIDRDSPGRVQAGIEHILHEALRGDGHCYLPARHALERAVKLLEVDPGLVVEGLQDLALERRVIIEELENGDRAIFPAMAFHTEEGITREVERLLGQHALSFDVDEDVRLLIAKIQIELGLELAEAQKVAVEHAVEGRMVIVTGGPGTGKTTLVRVLCEATHRLGREVYLAAPTGRAAKRLSEATGLEAKTLHRLLEYSFQAGGFQRNLENPLPEGLYVVDEASMIDIYLMKGLLEALPGGARLVLVGDIDQLPSVGPGTVLRDFIASDVVPVVTLSEVFRQAESSFIVRNAHRINQGLMPLLPDHENGETLDYFAITVRTPEEAEATVAELVTERLPRSFGLDPLDDIQVLCPMRVRVAGTDSLNEQLQALLNPDGKPVGRASGGLRIGDKIMQVRNNYDKDVFNGDVGRIASWDNEEKEAIVLFEEREVYYTYNELEDLVLAYACTIHKAQGSEFPAVVIPIVKQHYRLLQRNLVYTALTRARRLAIFVGHPRAMQIAVRNATPNARNTRLHERLAALFS